jgi:hypothetical protein
MLIEKLFLTLRTSVGVTNFTQYCAILETEREKIIGEYRLLGLVNRDDDTMSLTDAGLDVYNTIITRLVRF